MSFGSGRSNYSSLWWFLLALLCGDRMCPREWLCTYPSFIPPVEDLGLMIRLMDKILHDPKDPKLWEFWYIPYNG